MRVKRLEIQGFKSFKDKTVVHFDHSITGIVGPNGCGKSNIVDAFFWVMGEQSYKHMRGSGAEDLIFNGSSKYSPLGLAEATLVLETDVPDTENAPTGATSQDVPIHLRAKEIAVTRRVYRSGEGEYFINGVPARLKDIQELFMDTGVGAKGYSVIEQGQIGKIVNAKPEDRRLLIEEAAGIAKYKARKKESLRKMEATQSNLSRLNDVIQEIERNLASLERQAQKARLYKKYKDELLDKEMTWGRRKSQVFRQRLEALALEREALEQELTGLRAELQAAENGMEVDRISQLTDTKQAEDLQVRVQELSDELTRQQSALDLSRRRQEDLATQLESLQAEKVDLETAIQNDKQQAEQRQQEEQEATGAFQGISSKAQELDVRVRESRQNVDQARRDLENTRRNLMAGIAQATDLSSRSATLRGKMESAVAQAERLTQQVQGYSEKVQSAREEATRAREAAETTKIRREELASERTSLTRQVQEEDQKVRQAERARDEAAKQVTQLRSRLQSLEELDAAHEGFADGPKAALDWAKKSGKTESLRAIADALEVSAGYETALEGWFEGQLESLFSGDVGIALEALDHLREDKQGRAAIHLGSVDRPSEEDFSKVRGILASAGFDVKGELSRFVKVNDQIGENGKKTIHRMLSNVCVVESIKPAANFIAADFVWLECLGGWSIVGIDGSVLDRSGLLRGGSAQSLHATNVLGRKRAITELRDQAAAAEQAFAAAEAAHSEAKQILEQARERSQSLQSELQELDVRLAGLERDVHQMNRLLKDSESQLELAELEKTEMLEEAERARADQARVEAELNEIVSTRSNLEEGIATAEKEVSDRETAWHAVEGELQTLRIDEASLRERANSARRELEAARHMIRDRENRLVEVNRILERASREREVHTGGDTELLQKIEEQTLALAQARGELAQVKDRLEQTTAKLNGGLEKIKELHATGDQKTADANRVALDIEKVSGELNHLVQNLEEKYGPGCLERPVVSPIQEEMTEPVVTAEMTAEEELLLGEQVERLRERIRRLGEVNVMAIEEFEELKKRYDYLLTEKADLEQSIDNLQKAIDHINKTSEDRFAKAFEAIADRFERLFPVVFGGGQARLSLVYPEGSNDILEAGVDILAQPPGKKILNINALSGGEKALTAISMIFAIFMVKPSPFCLLDEVDAPLDDANIGKFNGLLREMSAKSQFILITHNKRTMELNDTLYGVTMEEPGVSKMVSIELH